MTVMPLLLMTVAALFVVVHSLLMKTTSTRTIIRTGASIYQPFFITGTNSFSTPTPTPTATSTCLKMSGNYNDRLSRYGGGYFPQEEEEDGENRQAPSLNWDYDDEADGRQGFDTDDMFAAYQNQNQNNNFQQQQQQQQSFTYAPPPPNPTPNTFGNPNNQYQPQYQPLQQQQGFQQQGFQQQEQQGFQQQQPPPPPQQQQLSQQPIQDGEDDLDDEERIHPKDIEGAQITEEFKAKVKASHNDPKEEASQGGSKFRQLMSRAQQTAGTTSTTTTMQQQGQNPYAYQPQQQQQSNVQIPSNSMDLSIEEQARLFRELMLERQNQYQYQQQQQQQGMYQQQQQQQPPQQQQQMAFQQNYPYQTQQILQQQVQQGGVTSSNGPTYSYREYGTGYDGRKIGRNKDADTISNAGDVYFAQLKRDSTSRNLARYAGDDNTANSVFHDPSIHEITVPVNPYREEQRAREREMLTTDPEEMLLFQEYGQDEEQQQQQQQFNNLSYKERLAQSRQRQGRGGQGQGRGDNMNDTGSGSSGGSWTGGNGSGNGSNFDLY